MKQLLLLLTLIVTSHAGSAQIVNIPDTNFKQALIDAGVDANGDGNIQFAEAEMVEVLQVGNKEISSIEGIDAFVNLKDLGCGRNPNLQEINLNKNTKLERLWCAHCTYIQSLDLSNNPFLKVLDCGFNTIDYIDIKSNLALEKLVYTACKLPGFVKILNTENNLQLKEYHCEGNGIYNLDISHLKKLEILNCRNNNLSLLVTKENLLLKELWCDENNIKYLDLDHLANLRILACGKNRMKSLRIKNLSKIEKVSLIGSKDTLELTLSNLPKLDSLKFNTIPLTVSNIRQIRLLGKHSLSHLICNDLQLGELIIEDMSTLKSINCHGNQLGELVLNNPNLLEEINLSNNKFENFELPFIPLLKHLNFNDNELFELKLLSCPTIENLRCRRNNISEIDIRNLSKLKYLDLAYNKLNFFEINHNALSICRLGNNNLDSIGIKSAQSLKSLWVDDNIFEELHLPSIPTLELLHCGSNQIRNLNCNHLPKLEILNASNNPLQSLFIKNGINTELSISDNLNLFLICTEIENSNYAQSQCPSCIVTTNCDNQNTIDLFQLNSKVLFDLNLDGCIGSKKSVPFSKFSVTNGNSNTLRYSAQDGQHQLKLLAGSYTIEPEIDFPKVYNLSPSTISLNFPQDSSPYVQDFCFSPLEQINDLDVSIIPLNEARPGFNYKFKVLYENVGTTFLDGEIQLEYDSQLMDLIVATPMPDNDVANPLIFKFEDLAPWEKGCIFINMELNRPTDEPALLGGDILKFKATGFTNPIDDLRQNNIACLNQEVVNSFDPNDKTCIEGHTINQNMIGEYVHYVIRFENTGTADAINISVVDEIDVSKFDIRTLKITDSSHELATKINGNVVEFIMENINLPFEDEFNDGYIAFKIKTLPTLALGESFENTANIYFDFNFPIITNTTSTTVIFRSSNQEINEDDKETIKLFPNPTSNKINIESQIAFDQLSILNTQGQLVREVHWTHPIKALDFPVEQLRSSVYFLKLETAEGSVLKKFIVEK